MVQLSPSPVLDLTPMSEHSEVTAERQGSPRSPTAEAPPVLSSLQLALASSTPTYQGYDTYVENGLICLKHKIRNIEKKKLKLEDYKQRLKAGEALNQDQLDAVEKYDEVVHNLAFARELQKTFSSLSQDLLKAQRKAVRREQLQKTEVEKKRLCTVLQVHYVLQSLQQEHVRKDFRSGLNGAPFLSARELEHLLGFSERAGCKRNESMSVEDQMEQAAIVYGDLLEGADKPVAGTTYKHLKEQLARLLDCGYFDHIPVPHGESLEEAVAEVVKKPMAPKRPAAGVPEPSVPLPKCEVPAREFLNRRYLPETDFRTQEQEGQPVPAWKAEFLALKQQEPPDSWDMEYTEKPASPPQSALKPWRSAPAPAPAPAPMPAPAPAPAPMPAPAPAPAPVPKEQVEVKPPAAAAPEPKQRRERKSRPEQEMKVAPKSDSSPVAVFTSPSPLPADPELRKRKLQDLMEEIQGSFSFMQDSVLEGEGSPGGGTSRLKHSALGTSTPIVQREPKKCPSDFLPKALKSAPVPAAQIPPKLGLTNGECSLIDSGVDIPAEEADQDKMQLSNADSYVPAPLYPAGSGVAESSVDKASDPSPAPASLPEECPPCSGTAPSTPPQGQAFSSPPSSHTLSMSAAPFQAMQTVFKVNAPLPPRSDSDMKAEPSSYSDSYSLSYSTASTQTPPECPTPSSGALEQDSLPPVSYPSDCVVSNGCPAYMSPGQHMGAFPRSSQPYYGRGAVRGAPRGARAPAHSYRSPSAYKGGFESYKNGMPSPGGNFIQPSYPARECTPILYGARESGFQQNYKRGGLTGQRASSRATWSDSSQVSSPERDNETFASVDSGQGDSRCITPIDVPVSAPGATLMPVHVYPLPQQMRVAFSAARTSNFAPGTLDQPIVFDLLLNNLGETFDMQLGRFSCPVNGTYVFIFHILKLAVNVPLYVNLMRNEEVMVSAYANDGAPDHETASNHAVLQLYQGDQIWLRLHRGAIYGSSWKYSTFSGYLLYQD